MTTLENTISMIKILPEADLVEIQNMARKMLQKHDMGCPFALKGKEEIYKDLEVSRQEIADGDYQDAGSFLGEVRKEYGI